MTAKSDDWHKGFLSGVARIVAMIARDFHEPDHAWNYLEETGRTLEEFRAAKVDPQDMPVIYMLFRQFQSKK